MHFGCLTVLLIFLVLWLGFPTSAAREDSEDCDCFRIACFFEVAEGTDAATRSICIFDDDAVESSGRACAILSMDNFRVRILSNGTANCQTRSLTVEEQYLAHGTLKDGNPPLETSTPRISANASFVFKVSGIRKVSKAHWISGDGKLQYCLIRIPNGGIPMISAIEFQPMRTVSLNETKPAATFQKLMRARVDQRTSANRRLIDDPNTTGDVTMNRDQLKLAVGLFLGIVAFLFLLIMSVIILCLHKRQKRLRFLGATESFKLPPKYLVRTVPEPEMIELKSREVQKFSLSELDVATKSFNNRIGEGGFGAVYHGILPDGQVIAVKVRSANSIQGLREFTTELTLLSGIRHSNLVPLVGYCPEQQILVYPYMSNGSLQDRLYGELAARRKPLDWITRLDIALGAARGLHFLHSTAGVRCIIHRDVKSSNILLDNSMVAKVADFGFSKYAPQEEDSMVQSLEVRGTAGYLDPEYYSTQQLTVKSDVFSFGVVLLEIVCGREPLNIHRPQPEWSLVEWAKPFIQESNIEAIVDQAIGLNYTAEAMWRVVEIALSSVNSQGVHRPTMEDIINELEDALIIENNASLYMASIESGGSLCLSMSDKKLPPPMPLYYQFDPSPVFSETMGSPDPR